MDTVDLVASLTAPAEYVEEVRRLLIEYGRHVRSMQGAERFAVYAVRDQPGELMVLERYRDGAAFDAHLADPENALLNGKLQALGAGASRLTFLTSLSRL